MDFYHMHSYESYGSQTRSAVVCVSFSAALFFLAMLERMAAAAAMLLFRLAFYGESSMREEPLLALAHQAERKLMEKSAKTQVESAARAYLQSLQSDGGGSSQSAIKGYAGVQLAGAFWSFLWSIASAFASCLMDGITSLTSYIPWAIATTLVFTLLYVIQVRTRMMHKDHNFIILTHKDT